MNLKSAHWWRTNGGIVVEVVDRDIPLTPMDYVRNPFTRPLGRTYTGRFPTVVATMELPRGTSKKEVAQVKKNRILMYEIKQNEVSK